jgi:transaldolase
MKTTVQLYELGQSLWLDNIIRELQDCAKLQRNCAEFSLSGLMSIPTIFDQAIRNAAANYDAIHRKVKEGESGEAFF